TDLRAFRGAHERAWADLDLDVGFLTGVEGVARRERSVEPGGGPVLSTGTPEGHVTVEVAQTRRRDLGRLRGGRRDGLRGTRAHEARAVQHDGQRRHDRDEPSRIHGSLLFPRWGTTIA